MRVLTPQKKRIRKTDLSFHKEAIQKTCSQTTFLCLGAKIDSETGMALSQSPKLSAAAMLIRSQVTFKERLSLRKTVSQRTI